MRQQDSARQKIVSVVPDGGSLFEIATPSGVWGQDRSEAGLPVDFLNCAIASTTVALDAGTAFVGLGVLADHVLDADMVIVPTWPIGQRPVSDDLIELLLAAHHAGARVVGLCLGAFAVAATGLLDGKTAVTHWRYRDRFEELFPQVSFEPDTLYVDHDDVVTSAGSAAAIDCCLHLIRKDHGAETAAVIARSMVTAPHRSGTQSQFATSPTVQLGDDPLTLALSAAALHIADVRSVGDLATLAQTSRRSLERHLQARLGVTPGEWIADQRLIAACRLLESTSLSVEEITSQVGYGSASSLRRALADRRQTTPTAYRHLFRTP